MNDIETANNIKVSLGGTQGPMGITRAEFEALNKGGPAGVYTNLAALQSTEDADKTRIYLTLDNGNWNYWNGNSWVSGGVYQAVEIKNGSITQGKTDFIELTDNLLNKETVKKDYTFSIVDSTYKEKEQSDSFISDFIPVEQNELYRVYAWSYAVFDSNKSFISGQRFNDNEYINIISTPNNASYVKITGAMSSINHLFFAKLSSKKNTNTYKLKNEDILQNIAEKSIVSEKLLFMKKPENNLFNNINNMYYCEFDLRGNIIYNQDHFISDFIKVEPNTEYHATCFQAAFYDNNQTLLEMRDFNDNTSNIFTTPNKTAFVRIVAGINYENTIFITKSIFHLERGNDALNRVKYFFNKEYVSLKDFIATEDIKNKAVTGNKVDFLIPCGNLFDYKSDIIKGYQLKLNSNGDGYYATQDMSNRFVSDFIEIEPDTEYKADAYDLIFWDKDKNFLSGTSSEKNNGNTYLSAISPSDARYATITGSSEEQYLSHLYLCKASNGVTPERKYTLSDNIIIDKLSNKVLNMPRYTKEVTNYNSDFPNKYYFMGRWELRNINEQNVMYTGYQGSKIYFVVKNTENITIELLDLNGVCTIAYKVDGKEFVRTTSSIIKISKLDKQFEHFIEIVVAGLEKETYIWTNDTGFALKIIQVDDGGVIKAISKKGRKILFYGDSITAGYCLYGTDSATQNGAEVNYVEQCCTLLGADNIRCAISGIGLFRQPSSKNVPNMLGNTDSNIVTTYTKNSPIDLFRKNIEEEGIEPDFIVVNLGTNDGAIDDETFKEGYISMIKRIEQKYPGTEIFCLRPFNGSKKTPILEATKECTNCIYVDTKDWKITYTDGIHPDLNGSKIAGEELADFLLKYFGKSYFLV